jgi:shikimate kinase
MPGCGKSAAGRRLAHITGRPFSDLDELIVKASGKGIPKIFETEGEAAFRALETNILCDEAKKSGIVIATGGGVVTQPQNLDLLRQNSVIVYLERELAELETAGRPLSGNIGVRTLAERRLPLYEAWGDHTVRVDADPGRTANNILEAIK